MTLLDTNVVIDLLGDGSRDEAQWSRSRLTDALAVGDVNCNPVILAELASRAPDTDRLLRSLDGLEIGLIDLPMEAALRAGQAFGAYRRRGGPRATILPDFLIAGHAAAIGARFVTRDRRLASYFPELNLITPETCHD